MNRVLILDAYNVIHKIPDIFTLCQIGLEDARKAFLKFMMSWRHKYNYQGRIIAVFDGDETSAFGNHRYKAFGVECIFTSKGEEADDRIIELVKRAENKDGIIVISEDKKVVRNCEACGAQVKHPLFLSKDKKLHAKEKSAEIKQECMDKKIAEDITCFYERYLKDAGVLK